MSTTVMQTAEVWWGYTMADIERLAWTAVRRHAFSTPLDNEDRYACAWHAIVMEIFGRVDAPKHHELIGVAFDALSAEVSAHRRHQGRRTDGGQESPKFKAYWHAGRQKHFWDDGFSERVCEHMALGDALRTLTVNEYEALVTLAAFDNHGKNAAAALGLTYSTFRHRVASGRKKVFEVWYGDETPPQRKTGTACRSGHLRSVHGRQRASDGQWVCWECLRISGRKNMRKQREAKRVEAFDESA